MRMPIWRSVMLAGALAVPLPLLAQEPAPAPSPSEAPKAKPAAAPTPEPRSRREPLPVSIRFELTLSDRTGDQPPVTKAVNVLLTDGSRSFLRFMPEVRGGTEGPLLRPLNLNVDARGWVEPGNKVSLELSVEYRSIDRSVQQGSYPTAELRFSGNLLLENGKSTLIAQSADPVSDRKATLEAKVTILK